MQSENRSWQKSYSIAVLASALALLFSLLVSPLLENITFSVFFAAVVLSSWYGTRGSGLLATFLCSLAIADFFLRPSYSLAVLTLDGLIRLGLFVVVSLLTTELNSAWRRTELKLRESESRYREMVDAVQDYAIFRLDPQGRVITWNAGAENINGYTAKEILGQHFSCFYPASDLEQDRPSKSLQIAASAGRFAEEGWRVRKNGSQFWASVLLTAIPGKQGKLLGFSSIIRDITEQKRTEEELKGRSQQQKAIAQLGQLALSGMNLRMLMNETVTLVAQTLDAEYCKVLQLFPEGNILLLRAGVGWQPELIGHLTISATTDFQPGYTLVSSQPVVVFDIHTEKRFRASPLLRDRSIISGISVIINGHSPPWGVLAVHTTRKRTFSQNDINFLQAVANILAEAIDGEESAQALQQSYSLLQSVIEGTNDPVFVKDLQGRYQLINTATAQVFGTAKDKILGKNDTELLSTEVGTVIRENDRRIMSTGTTEVLEEVVIEAGSLHTYLSTKDPYRDPEGNIIGIIGIARDITERKQAEVALFRSNQRLETLQAIDRAILMAESTEQIAQAALESLTEIIVCQQAAIILFNFNTNEAQILAGEIALHVAGSVIPIANLAPVEMVRYQEPILYVEDIATFNNLTPALEHQLAAGSRSFLAVALVVEGNLIGDLTLFASQPAAFNPEYQTIAREIANQLAIAIQQSRLRQQLQNYANELEQRVADRTAALVEANNELETFGYSVSHDLRAPLRSMQGLAQALQEDYGDLLDSDGQEYIQRIVTSAKRMDGLIQDLLDYSRLSRLEIKLRVLNLREIIAEAINQLETESRSRQAQINIEQPLPEVIGHRTTLIQVLVNLLSNAIKFVPANRQPQIRVWAEIVGDEGVGGDEEENTSLSPSSPSSIRLWVEDNGIGIAPEHQQRIFNVFERLHGEESYPGSGIGLAIVRKGVERMGGHVGVESIVSQGSRFWIELQQFSMKT
ncbi:PAS domain S-box protein [Nostoc sp. C117]|uniref:PAS domain S-box protein n=1 Tax=Nostoc sp. C117 TaxID=3349875 RepID=UPI00370D317C